jgi:hypothetical protein
MHCLNCYQRSRRRGGKNKSTWRSKRPQAAFVGASAFKYYRLPQAYVPIPLNSETNQDFTRTSLDFSSLPKRVFLTRSLPKQVHQDELKRVFFTGYKLVKSKQQLDIHTRMLGSKRRVFMCRVSSSTSEAITLKLSQCLHYRHSTDNDISQSGNYSDTRTSQNRIPGPVSTLTGNSWGRATLTTSGFRMCTLDQVFA